jgi:hypothetical protein
MPAPVSFFDPPPPPPPPEPGPPLPEWHGPPDNVVPASFPLDLVIARTGSVAVFVHSGRAYANGFEFTLAFRLRTARHGRAHDPVMSWHGTGGAIADDVLRFGIAFADGRKATVFDRFRPPWPPDEEPPPPDIVLMQRGGGGGGSSWDMRFWAWPLPPEGPVGFVVEWPSEGISLTRADADSTAIREAARRVQELWPEEGPAGGGAWTRYA